MYEDTNDGVVIGIVDVVGKTLDDLEKVLDKVVFD